MTHASETPAIRTIRADTVLGEGPLWCPDTEALWWIDGFRPQLLRWQWGANTPDVWPLARPPAALARLPNRRLLIAFRERFGYLEQAGGPVNELPFEGLDLGDERFNDAKVDSHGRLWIGTIDRKLTRPIGRLRRIDEQAVNIMAEGFALSNGIGWSPDDRAMYFSESYERRLHRFDYDAATGDITPAGNLALINSAPAKPDGLTVDCEGGIWCAIFGGGRLERYLPDGRLDRQLQLPVTNPTSCMFGGPDLRTLFITTAKYSLNDDQLRREPLAGSVLAVDVGVTGRPENVLAKENGLAKLAAQHAGHASLQFP